MNWIDFDGRVVVVTGAAGGIGLALLGAFSALGARVVAIDRDAEQAREAAKGHGGHSLACDVSDPGDVARMADAVARLGGVAALVNNAGVLRPGPLETLASGDWAAMLRVNLDGCLLCAQALVPQMVAAGGGALVHVASISASQPQPFSGAYSPGKAAVAMLSRQMAAEWGPKGIRSNVVSPGLLRTPLSEGFYADPEIRAAREAMVPLRRIGTAEDMAAAAVFLASDRASYVTGQEIVVDGGLSQTLMGLVPRPGYAES